MTARVIRTERWLYQKTFLVGKDALYDLQSDPEQRRNLAEDAEYADVVADLDARLTDFFVRYADPRYDLWQGGTAKLRLFGAADQELFGEQFSDWQRPGLGFDQTIFRDE